MWFLLPLYADFWYLLMGLVLFYFFAWPVVPGKTADWKWGMCVVCSGSLLVTPVSFHFTPLVILSFLPYVSQFPLTPGAFPSAGECRGHREMEKEAGMEGETHVSGVTLPRSVNSYWSAVFLMCSMGRLPQRGGGSRHAHGKANTQRAGVIEISLPCFLCHVPPLSSISLSRAVDWSSSSCCLGLCHYPLCH